jgi:hypothetical protein
MIRDLLCTFGRHRWTLVRKYLRGISLYEEESCRDCPARSTVVSGIVDVQRLDGHFSRAIRAVPEEGAEIAAPGPQAGQVRW